jgi:hypothetical protein
MAVGAPSLFLTWGALLFWLFMKGGAASKRQPQISPILTDSRGPEDAAVTEASSYEAVKPDSRESCSLTVSLESGFTAS